MPDSGSRTEPRANWFWLTAILMLGLACRLRGITSALDTDEIFSLQAALGSWSHTLQVALHDRPHPPLHLILLHPWVHLFGPSSIAERSLSVVASLVFLVAVWGIARRFDSIFVAVAATAVCAVSPFFATYGQQARPYAMVACFSAVSAWALLRWTESPLSRWRGATYLLSCCCLALTHYPGVLFVLVECLILVAVFGFPVRRILGPLASSTPAFAWFGVARWLNGSPLGSYIGWIDRPRLADVPAAAIEVFGWPPFPHGGGLVILATLSAAVGLVFAVSAISSREKRVMVIVVALAFSIPSALFLISTATATSYWAYRQMIGSAAMWVLAIAVGLSRCTRVVRWGLAGVLLSCVAGSSWATPPESIHPAWDRVAKTIAERCPGCRVGATEPWVAAPLSFYLGRTVEIYGDLPDVEQGLIMVCRDSRCVVPRSPARMQPVAQFDWGQGASHQLRVSLVETRGQ